MSNLKLKSLRLTKTKVAEIEGERRVTFVASTDSEDRDYERVMIETFRLPKKGGGEIRVSDIPEGGTDEVDIPLLTDHDLFAVDKVIGSVRRAYFTDGELIFEAGISSRDYAQDVFKLIDEGHLDNAFSISFRDFDYNPDNGEIRNGEIIEVSLVTRGSNKDARVLEVKGLKEGEEVEEPTTTPAEEVKKEEVVEAPAETTEPVEAEPVEEKTEDSEAEAPAEAEEEAVEADEEAKEEKAEAELVEETKESEEESEGKENEMDAKSIAQTQVAEPAQAIKEVSTDYLKSKSATKDFIALTVEMKGQSPDTIVKAWKKNLESKGISGDAILPAQLENIFFKAWYDQTGVLSTFRNIRTNASAMYAFVGGDGEYGRAHGHKKGETKLGQTVTSARRDLKQKVIYKMLAIDLQDLLDDQTGELNAFRAEELAGRVADEIARGAIIGDGRQAPVDSNPDYRVFDGTRGLFSMAADINAVSGYGTIVATKLEAAAGDNLYDKIVKALGNVREINGQGKVVIVPTGSIAALKIAKNNNGSYLFPVGANIEDAIDARIFEMDGIQEAGFDVIAYANQGYGLYATNDMVRTSFDLNTNSDAMLVERSVAGSAYGYKAVAGYPTSASA